MSQHAGAGGDASGLYEFHCRKCGNMPLLPITGSGCTTVCPECNVDGYMSCIDPRLVALECRDSECVYSRSRKLNNRLLSFPRRMCANCEPSEEANGIASCPICLEKFKLGVNVKELPCGHAFHIDCIADWFQRGNTCPNCRAMSQHAGADLRHLYSPRTPPSRSADGSRGTPGGTRNRNNNGRG